MLAWLRGIVSSFWSGVSAGVKDFVHTVVAGVAGVVSTVFHTVTSAWDDLVTAAGELESAAFAFGKATWQQLDKVLTYWIPRYAFTAWWWVTHVSELALVLLWHLLAWLEHYAWTAARYLGEFGLALFARNARRWLQLIETIVAAVL